MFLQTVSVEFKQPNNQSISTMKKVYSILCLIVLLSMFLSNCGSTNVVPMNESFVTISYDFREYTEKGFMFTPEKYLGEYESIGLIEVLYIPEFKDGHSDDIGAHVLVDGRIYLYDKQDEYMIYADPHTQFKLWFVSRPNTTQLIREAFESADEMGANAITNFRIIPTFYDNNKLEVSTVKLSGFAIRRIE